MYSDPDEAPTRPARAGAPAREHAIQLRGDPSALAYDYRSDLLCVADAYSGAVIAVDHHRNTQRRIATIDAAGVVSTQRIAGLAVARNGTLYISRVGYGEVGAIFEVPAGGLPRTIDRLSPRAWRGGVYWGEGAVYATQYRQCAEGPHSGEVIAIAGDGTHTLVADGFAKPISVVSFGELIVVSDAHREALYRIERGDCASESTTLHRFLELPNPGALCRVGHDSLLVTSYHSATGRGAVHRIWLDGRSRLIAEGQWLPRGVATDGERVFIATLRTGKILVVPLYFGCRTPTFCC